MNRGFVRRWSVIVLVSVCCCAGRTAGSAIPMWEFLTRDEKMSHIYGIFLQQVTKYCSNSPLPDCNKNLLISGIGSLANMDDNQLDRMDPYQRGAKDTIWRAMLNEKRLIKSKFFHDDPFENADPMATSESDRNDLGEESATMNDYARPSDHAGPYLVGPMVIRVFPDGRPVPEDAARPLPRDEDIDDLDYPKIPSIADIGATDRRFHYKKPNYDATTNKRNIYGFTTDNRYRYRRVNPLMRERRPSDEISATDRPIFRYY